MNILFILIIVNIFSITIEFSRLILSTFLGVKPQEFGIFMGLKIFKFELKGIEFRINMIPFSAYMVYKDEKYLLMSTFKRVFLRYYDYLILAGFLFVIHKYYGDNYVLNKASLVLLITGTFGFIMNIKNSIKEHRYMKELKM